MLALVPRRIFTRTQTCGYDLYDAAPWLYFWITARKCALAVSTLFIFSVRTLICSLNVTECHRKLPNVIANIATKRHAKHHWTTSLTSQRSHRKSPSVTAARTTPAMPPRYDASAVRYRMSPNVTSVTECHRMPPNVIETIENYYIVQKTPKSISTHATICKKWRWIRIWSPFGLKPSKIMSFWCYTFNLFD